MIKVGYERDTYAEKRLIINKAPSSLYVDVSKFNLKNFPRFFDENEKYNTSRINVNTVDIIHFFNQINLGQTPYITTFESIVPRYWNRDPHLLGVNAISKANCKKIIAISQSACTIHQQAIETCTIPLKKKELILEKTTTMHPPQMLINNDQSRFSSISELKCLFVGNDFFRKGGLQLLRVLDKFRKNGYPVRLTIISSMAIGYNVTDAKNEDMITVIEFILQNRDWIDWYRQVENCEVLRIASMHHLGFLPTFSDTYGYSVLEMQAAGVPVVTTAIKALPEINNNACGWIIKHPEMNGFCGFLPTKKEIFMNIIEISLEKIISSILADKRILQEKSTAAMDRILQFHDPDAYGSNLQALYESVC